MQAQLAAAGDDLRHSGFPLVAGVWPLRRSTYNVGSAVLAEALTICMHPLKIAAARDDAARLEGRLSTPLGLCCGGMMLGAAASAL
jgi:hypothetical protein